jgi:hypothetical protein
MDVKQYVADTNVGADIAEFTDGIGHSKEHDAAITNTILLIPHPDMSFVDH